MNYYILTAECHLPDLIELISSIEDKKKNSQCANCYAHLKKTRNAFDEFMNIVHESHAENPAITKKCTDSSGSVLVIPSILNKKRKHLPKDFSDLLRDNIELSNIFFLCLIIYTYKITENYKKL